jgi:ABC-type nitrate/sulfonate/bicarbonate transport system ATPase subunit/protein associated with RNAse G/E
MNSCRKGDARGQDVNPLPGPPPPAGEGGRRPGGGDSLKLSLRHVSKTFHAERMAVRALVDVSFDVRPGEFVTLIGPSGSGKSTLFNIIVGLLDPDEGEVWLDGELAPNRLGRVAYMPQRDLLLPWRTVIDNAIIPLELAGIPREQARERARELLPPFGLKDFGDAYPPALSGGMRQRAALLRTALAGRDVLLLDEPFGALDALTRRELQDWLLEMWRQFGQTVLFVTHDVEEALYLADRVVVLTARPGKVCEVLEVALPRPRRRAMIATTAFTEQMAHLMAALGIGERVTVIKGDHTGKEVWRYRGAIVARTETVITLEARFDLDIREMGYVTFREGDRFLECHHADRWYSLYEVHDRDDDRLKGWYVNFSRPAIFTDSAIKADDLALDLWVAPDGQTLELDREEFDALPISEAERAAVLQALAEVKALLAARRPPFEAEHHD